MNNKIKKVFTYSVVFATIVWSMGLAAVVPVAEAAAGDLVKMEGSSAVYYIGSNNKRYAFPDEATYKSWYVDFSGVQTLDSLGDYENGGNVTLRPGLKLVQEVTSETPWQIVSNKVYAVDMNGLLHWVTTAAVAEAIFGADWATKINPVQSTYFTSYDTSGADLAAAADYDKDAVYAASSSIAVDKGLDVVIVTPETGTGALTVAASTSQPAATSVVAHSTNGSGAQSLVSMLNLNFTASSAADVTVTTLKLKRLGISSDTTLSAYYLYEGDTFLAEYNSVVSGVVTFTGSSLFKVSAGTTKTINVKADVANGTGSGQTMALSLNAAADVVGAASVGGSFPITGNTMTTATVSDLGQLTVASVSYPTQVAPGSTETELWRFSAVAANQKMLLSKVKLTKIGNIDSAHLANFKLYDGATQLGATAASLATDGTVTFDISPALEIKSGVTKNLSLKGDVLGGSTRTYYFSLQSMRDVVVYDSNYGVYVKPNSADSWTIIKAAAVTTITGGSLTMTRSSGAPSGNVALNSTAVELASYDFKATGEDIKVRQLGITLTCTTCTNLRYGKIMVDGVQKGTTATLTSGSATTFAFSNSFIIPSGTTVVVKVVADVASVSGAATPAANGHTLSFVTVADADGAYAMSSAADVAVTAVASNTLTVSTGTVTVTKNSAMGDASAAVPTGVAGASEVRLASFIVTAGSGENAQISQFTIKDISTALGSYFYNLLLKDSAGTQIGNTYASPSTSASQTYSFTPSSVVTITKSQQYRVDVYGSILSSATAGALTTPIAMDAVTAVGANTNSDASYGTDVNGQNVYIASAGALYVYDGTNAATPSSKLVVMSSTATTTPVEIAKFKFEASTAEDLVLEKVVVVNDLGATGGVNDLMQIKLYDGDTLLGTVESWETSDVDTTYGNGYAIFSGLAVNVPLSGTKTLTVKATPNYSTQATSGSSHTFKLLTDYLSTGTAASVVYHGAQSQTQTNYSGNKAANAMYMRKSVPTVATVALDSTVLVSTTIPVYRFSVTADSAGSITVKKFTFDVGVSNYTGDTFTVNSATPTLHYRQGTSGSWTQISSLTVGDGAGGTNYATNDLLIMLGSELTIDAGSSMQFELRMTIVGSSSSDALTISLVASDEPSTVRTGYIVSDTDTNEIVQIDSAIGGTGLWNANFLWSDRSAGVGRAGDTLGSSSADYCNDALVNTLPTAATTLRAS